MTLDELAAEQQPEADTDDTEYPNEEAEEGLSNALSLIEEMNELFIAIMDPAINRRITAYMLNEIVKLSQEAMAFLQEYELPDRE